jgi:hypothetical protein
MHTQEEKIASAVGCPNSSEFGCYWIGGRSASEIKSGPVGQSKR